MGRTDTPGPAVDGDDVSRLWMYSHRASSITRALFSDGMAGKSKVSRVLNAEMRAARMRRSTMRW